MSETDVAEVQLSRYIVAIKQQPQKVVFTIGNKQNGPSGQFEQDLVVFRYRIST